jgi:type IV pilus assembly protein PilE
MKHNKRGFTLIEMMVTVAIVGILTAADTANFTYVASNLTPATWTLTAKGLSTGKLAGLEYTINQSGTRATTVVPARLTGWVTKADCWVDRKGGLCTQ